MTPFPPIAVRQPLPFDLVDVPVRVVGVGTGFEGRLGARLRDADGVVLVEVAFDVGGTGIWGNFALDLDPGGIVSTNRGTVEVFEPSARDGSDLHRQVVPVAFGPVLIEDYLGFAQHTVTAGDTLSGLAKEFYGDAERFPTIFDANRDVLDDPDEIRAGQVLRVPQ